MTSTCSTCRWFLAAPAIDLSSTAPHGECRRLPPTRSDIATPHGIGNLSGWPTTKRQNWCGEYASLPTTAGNAA